MSVTKRIHYTLVLGATALALSLAGTPPAAKGAVNDISFLPGAFSKAHPALGQEVVGFCPGLFECVMDNVSGWVQQIKDAPEEIQAGGHPDITTHFRFPQITEGEELSARAKRVITDTPAGSVGNPLAVPRCEQAEFNLTIFGHCRPDSQLGGAITLSNFFGNLEIYSPVSSIVPSPGQSALLGFKVVGFTALLVPEVRSDSDYGLRVNVDEIPFAPAFFTGSTITFWGVPHDPVHDPVRFNDVGELGNHIVGTPRPFLIAPTNCSTGPITLIQKALRWELPEQWAETTSTAPEPTGCDQVGFEPDVTARPTTNIADSPSGLEVDVHTPQNEGCEQIEPAPPANEPQFDCGVATSHLKDTTLTLPEGLAINPASANGLSSCTTEQIGLTTPLGVTPQQFTKAVPDCPPSSRIASVEVDTPLLDAPAPGSVFLAEPWDNPFESLLAIYVVADDRERGLIIKLAGEVKADPVTGQLTTRVENAPQLPFHHFLLHFKQGPHATLRTPAACGSYETTAELTPYSAPESPVPTSDQWQISQGPGGSCASDSSSLPNTPFLDAGTVSPNAGAFSPFVMHLRRDDGTQSFKSVSVSPPPGLVAKLAGVGRCSEADLATAASKSGAQEAASPSCPASSELGEVVAGAGAGPSPYYAHGTAYLAGPYKGAPLSMAIITPATAGPFDLGTILVRTALYLDSKTARITAVSDEIPQILEGIPLDVRTIDLFLDRDQFTKTGTSCDPASVDGQLTSTLGQIASIQSRFQLAECSSLGFKPKLSLSLRGGTKRGKHPALTAVLKPRPGDANLAGISVALPRSEFLDQGHIGTVCTRVQFAADACPAASTYGEATVTTPLFDFPLKGNVYLRSSNNELPDLVPDLRGPADTPIRVEAAGRTDSINGRIRNTFDAIPDAPFTKLVMELKGGKKGLLQNSRDICSQVFRATVEYTAQNGKVREGHPALTNSKCGHAKKRKGKGARRRLAHSSAVR